MAQLEHYSGGRVTKWGRWVTSLAQGTEHLTAPEDKDLPTHLPEAMLTTLFHLIPQHPWLSSLRL